MPRTLSTRLSVKSLLATGCAVVALMGASIAPVTAYAEQGSGAGKQSHGAGAGAGGAGGGHGQSGQMGKGGGGGGLGGIFRDITGFDSSSTDDDKAVEAADEGDDDSDRPEWAGGSKELNPHRGDGNQTPGTMKGDLFGDLWVILRDSNGEPILTDEGWVQPLDANGDLVALDEEGHPLDESLTIEVEMGRLNVGRAPTSVLDRRADEVIAVLQSADEISTDAAGRLVLTIDGEDKTIDSPLENLAIYVALLTNGSIPGLGPDDLAGTDFDFLVDGVFDERDLAASTAFLAAATDKTGTFTSDEIAYIDAFLGINTTTQDGVTYSVIDYSSFDYDRSDTYEGVMATVLVPVTDGDGNIVSYEPKSVDIYEEVFGDVDVSVGGTLDAYTQAAEDARLVIEFVHEFAVPETS